MYFQIPLTGPSPELLQDTTLVGPPPTHTHTPFFIKNRKAIVLNEASTSTGELMACMSVWTVNLPALHQHDKQWCYIETKKGGLQSHSGI